jgi:hypothetical protein
MIILLSNQSMSSLAKAIKEKESREIELHHHLLLDFLLLPLLLPLIVELHTA